VGRVSGDAGDDPVLHGHEEAARVGAVAVADGPMNGGRHETDSRDDAGRPELAV
jgi:hypothetical protein